MGWEANVIRVREELAILANKEQAGGGVGGGKKEEEEEGATCCREETAWQTPSKADSRVSCMGRQ